jgi:hypothetical protein
LTRADALHMPLVDQNPLASTDRRERMNVRSTIERRQPGPLP